MALFLMPKSVTLFGMRKRAIGVLIRDREVLVMHRISAGNEYYVFPGGGVEDVESDEEAMKREIKEEVSLDVLSSKEIFRVEDWGTLHIFYLVTDFRGDMVLGGEEKERSNSNDQYLPTWFSLDDVKKLHPFYPEDSTLKIFEIIESLK